MFDISTKRIATNADTYCQSQDVRIGVNPLSLYKLLQNDNMLDNVY